MTTCVTVGKVETTMTVSCMLTDLPSTEQDVHVHAKLDHSSSMSHLRTQNYLCPDLLRKRPTSAVAMVIRIYLNDSVIKRICPKQILQLLHKI